MGMDPRSNWWATDVSLLLRFLKPKGQGQKSKANALGNNKHTTQKQNKQEICPVTRVQLMCQIFMNDLLTEEGHQRSRVIR